MDLVEGRVALGPRLVLALVGEVLIWGDSISLAHVLRRQRLSGVNQTE